MLWSNLFSNLINLTTITIASYLINFFSGLKIPSENPFKIPLSKHNSMFFSDPLPDFISLKITHFSFINSGIIKLVFDTFYIYTIYSHHDIISNFFKSFHLANLLIS